MIIENLISKEKVDQIKYVYFYRLLKGKIAISYSHKDVEEVQAYGIEIERQDILDGKLINVQRDSVQNISPERYKVHNLLKLLYDNKVSPIHLVDVIGDYVDEYSMDFDNQKNYAAY
ncbi:DUF6514 family protein [Clostridium coskatii]|uniref:Uncharacterized protein n=1 Tax=Clostridium coskatii TaxID=1705578 RepID=A0A166T7U5_9CLOT|nr:DUF6514 family protein [Clostridium coskatii]OAA93379.1 hypothetical protein WX73_00071 [Clostridium coskatii]OBR92483.1 hypothetical protein CLCOS_29460 [Clostridium coskatii]